jgi:exopolysaccharide biosynthesis WecB/TagA/CpsF family protein
MQPESFRFLNIDIHNWDFEEFLEQLESGFVVTPNVDHLIKLQKDKSFYACYQSAEHVVCDSRILLMLSKFISRKNALRSQIAGSDLFPAFCHYHRQNTDNVRVFLLGGSEESVRIAQEKINEKTGSNIVIGGYSPPFGFEQDADENAKILKLINDSGATALAVGVGAPKQEFWISTYRSQLPGVKLFFAIGATIEFEAGAVKRSPAWMSKLGIEWYTG